MEQEIEIVHKCYEVINDLKKDYPIEILLQNSADQIGITKSELERLISKYDLYKYDDQSKKYILR